MATRIKAVKCPQCGSEKHEQLDEKRYRCLNCGTEFFLDDDDINRHQTCNRCSSGAVDSSLCYRNFPYDFK